MCEIMEELRTEGYQEGFLEGEEKGETKGEIRGNAVTLLKLLNVGLLTKEQVLEQFGGTYEELERASL